MLVNRLTFETVDLDTVITMDNWKNKVIYHLCISVKGCLYRITFTIFIIEETYQTDVALKPC